MVQRLTEISDIVRVEAVETWEGCWAPRILRYDHRWVMEIIHYFFDGHKL